LGYVKKGAYILAIDQGTTSSRAIVFDTQSRVVGHAQMEFPQIYPRDGWVEHDPAAIWSTTLQVARQAFDQAEAKGGTVAAIGITNQRETTVLWDRETGEPVYRAIVWQDRRTADACRRLEGEGLSTLVQQRTGLRLDPYFSASKIAWILDHVDGARTRAREGRLAFGTIDSFLIARLTGGRVHATDATNASRTGLFHLERQDWDGEMLRIFDIPASILPVVLDCADDFGETQAELFGRAIPIAGVAGDQQAAAFGQGCFTPGAIKSTYGTGCFVLMNTGDRPLLSRNHLLTTVACRLKGKPSYALEGSIFIAGAAVQWLRDGLGIIDDAEQTQALVGRIEGNDGVYMVPAFTGLGAPWWDPDVRGAIYGLTRATGPAHFVRAALESVAYQTWDLFHAMAEDGLSPSRLRVDGGMAANDWFVQFLADILDLRVDRPAALETTALGAAYLAGMQIGVIGGMDEIAASWRLERRFAPRMDEATREGLLQGWHEAVRRTLSTFASPGT
jgi:glycerol kinase